MPFKKSELDPITSCVMQALAIIRDLPPAPIEIEQVRNEVYKHLSAAANAILNANYIARAEGSDLRLLNRNQALLDAFQDALKDDLEL
jgi:hypothetical protein